MKPLSKEDLEYLRTTNTMISTPMYGNQCMGSYCRAVFDLGRMFNELKIPLGLNVLYNESLVQRARNAIAFGFMKQSPCTHLMFIDADISFNPQHIVELLLARKDIIGASYSKKSINWPAVRQAMENGVRTDQLVHCSGNHVVIADKQGPQEIPLFDPYEVRYLGTGFMLITRKAFEEFEKAYPDHWYKNNHIPSAPMGEKLWAYFDCDIDEGKIYRSEDYYFCGKMRKAGMKIWLAPWQALTHFGTYAYEGCFFCSHGGYVHDIMNPKPEEKK